MHYATRTYLVLEREDHDLTEAIRELDAVPTYGSVLDGDGDLWSKQGDGCWCWGEEEAVPATLLIRRFGPINILQDAAPVTDDEMSYVHESLGLATIKEE